MADGDHSYDADDDELTDDQPLTGLPAWDDPDIRLCHCGCNESSHTLRGCRYCSRDQCDGFVYDEEATILSCVYGES